MQRKRILRKGGITIGAGLALIPHDGAPVGRAEANTVVARRGTALTLIVVTQRLHAGRADLATTVFANALAVQQRKRPARLHAGPVLVSRTTALQAQL